MTSRLITLTLVLAFGALACGGNGGHTAGPYPPCAMPPDATYSGKWFTNMGQMELTQTGSTIAGNWSEPTTHKTGRIEGTLNGCLAFFSWYQSDETIPGRPRLSNGRGVFRYVVPPAGSGDQTHVFEGVWGYGTETEGGGTWTGRKSRRD